MSQTIDLHGCQALHAQSPHIGGHGQVKVKNDIHLPFGNPLPKPRRPGSIPIVGYVVSVPDQDAIRRVCSCKGGNLGRDHRWFYHEDVRNIEDVSIQTGHDASKAFGIGMSFRHDGWDDEQFDFASNTGMMVGSRTNALVVVYKVGRGIECRPSSTSHFVVLGSYLRDIGPVVKGQIKSAEYTMNIGVGTGSWELCQVAFVNGPVRLSKQSLRIKVHVGNRMIGGLYGFWKVIKHGGQLHLHTDVSMLCTSLGQVLLLLLLFARIVVCLAGDMASMKVTEIQGSFGKIMSCWKLVSLGSISSNSRRNKKCLRKLGIDGGMHFGFVKRFFQQVNAQFRVSRVPCE